MKRENISIGHRYTDGKGNVRLVVGIGSEYLLYDGQTDRDCLRYRIIAKKRGPYQVGEECNSTMKSFCSWAKNIVGIGEEV